MKIAILLVCTLPAIAFGQQEGKRAYQTDSIGNVQYHKQSWIAKDGKLCPVDTIGNRQHHMPCLAVGSKEMDKALKASK